MRYNRPELLSENKKKKKNVKVAGDGARPVSGGGGTLRQRPLEPTFVGKTRTAPDLVGIHGVDLELVEWGGGIRNL